MLSISKLSKISSNHILAGIASGLLLAGCGGGGGGGTEAHIESTTGSSTAGTTSGTSGTSGSTTTTGSGSTSTTAGTSSGTTGSTGTGQDNTATAVVCKAWGTFAKPFSAASPWNSRPAAPVLGSAVIPTSSYYPAVANGTYGSEAFEAKATDGPVVITGPTSSGVWDPDAEAYRTSITLPHWPEGVVPASGSDGHAEVVDTTTGIVHSFWKLKQVNGAWVATQYAWTPLAGRGMGDPAHYFQGARAAGTSTLGGLIRKTEVNDGDTMYRHALAMSLAYNGLSAAPTYQFPATSADSDAAGTNSGQIPMGALMMLPATFNAQALTTPELRKVAETLKTYGAYVVDRNTGTPFVIYVENNADFKLHKNGWSNATAKDLDDIRAALRPLASTTSWLDGNGQTADVATTALNLLSMRGFWYRTKGTVSGVYDTWRQAVVFPATTTAIEQINDGGRAVATVSWATPAVGETYKLTVKASGGAKMRMTIMDKTTNLTVYDSGDLGDGQTAQFSWPAASFKVKTTAKSGTANVESTVGATLIKVTTGTTAATSACPV